MGRFARAIKEAIEMKRAKKEEDGKNETNHRDKQCVQMGK
jgi:hypothetical protein